MIIFAKSRNKLLILFGFIELSIFLYWQNNGIVVSKYLYKNKKVPKKFDGFKILQISDLQDKMFFKNQSSLINKIKTLNADIIVITGDLLNCRHSNFKNAEEFIKKAIKISPVYYVSGNHELVSGLYYQALNMLNKLGVETLENKSVILKIDGDLIKIMGIKDIRENVNYKTEIKKMIKKSPDIFNILLTHRPELIDVYADCKVDIAFCGHAHGGQIRLPFIGGLFAPNQGILPKYTKGIHKKGNTSVIISRGLGNSIFPFRIFNRPEVVLVELKNR